MSFRVVPDQEKKIVKKHWKESKGNRDEFKKRIINDRKLKGKWLAYDQMARRMDQDGEIRGYGGFKSRLFIFAQLKPEDQKKIAKILSEEGVQGAKKQYPQFTPKQFRSFAKRDGLKIKRTYRPFKEEDIKSEKNKACRQRLEAIIQDGSLLKLGLSGIIDVLKKEFRELVSEISQDQFRDEAEDLIWNINKEALNLLIKFVREGLDLAPVYKRLGHVIPQDLIDLKAKRLRGVRPEGTSKKSTIFEAGIGRIATDSEVEQIQNKGIYALQHYTLESPFKVTVKTPQSFRVLIICGAHLGLEYNRVLDENVLRNTLRYAQDSGVDAIIITAGLMWTDMKKSSGRLTTHRALYHGLDFDPEVIDPEYRAEAIEIRNTLPPNRISFATLRERVMNAFGGWRKVTTHKNGHPIFEGPIFFSFGYPEEEMIENAAHEHLRYLKVCMELDARAERRAAEAELHYELMLSNGKETPEVKRLREEVQRLLRLEKRKSANTNIEKLDHKRFVSIIRTLLISWYQEAIPNSQFISQGNLVCNIGDKKIEIQQARFERPTERDITHLIKSVGQRDLEGTLPDVILGAGAYNLNARWSARECMRGTQMDQVHVWQLPVLIDRDYVREAKSEMIKRGSPIERLIGDWRFEPGAFILGITDGVWNSYPLPISMFTQRYPKAKTRSNPPKELIIFAEGDQHTDNPNKEYVWDARTQQTLAMEVAASEIFMREFVEKGKLLPFHIFSSHGDSTQGRHFPTEQNRHPQHESRGVLEAESAELLRKISSGEIKPNELKELSSKLIMRLNHQIRFRGEHWYQQQMEDFIDHSIERRARFFLEILKRGKSANVKTRNIEEVLTGIVGAWDRRGIARVNLLDGNHGGKTTLGTVAEAWAFARILFWSVFAEKDCPFTREELKRLVCAPIYGPVASGYGLVSIAGGYEWGLHLRHDPTRKSGQDGDPLSQAVKNLAERGDYGLIFNKHNFVTIVGDQHRYAAAYAPGKAVFNCACSTHGDSYGDDWGFSRSNLGGMIICLPIEGPGAGPIRMIPISHVFIRQYMAKPWKIDWDKLFPNPA